MSSPTWIAYVETVTGGAQQRAIAKATGIGDSEMTRWFKLGRTPSPEKAIQFARGYDVSPVEALVVAGYLTPAEAAHAVPTVVRDLSTFNVQQLAQEILNRAQRGEVDENDEVTLTVDPKYAAHLREVDPTRESGHYEDDEEDDFDYEADEREWQAAQNPEGTLDPAVARAYLSTDDSRFDIGRALDDAMRFEEGQVEARKRRADH